MTLVYTALTATGQQLPQAAATSAPVISAHSHPICEQLGGCEIATLAAMPDYLIKGHSVARDDQRCWHCDCSDYERRLVKYGEGFCEHLMLAIEHSIEERRITLPAH
jgi:hypothetical protein